MSRILHISKNTRQILKKKPLYYLQYDHHVFQIFLAYAVKFSENTPVIMLSLPKYDAILGTAYVIYGMMFGEIAPPENLHIFLFLSEVYLHQRPLLTSNK